MSTSLADRLAPIIARFQQSNGRYYDELTAFMERTGQIAGRLGVGDRAPEFSAPSHDGHMRRLQDLIAERPTVLVFIRGMWCPYCQEQLRMLDEMRNEFDQAGLNLVAITPETGGRAAEMVQALDLGFEVICDVDSGIALSYGCLFAAPPHEREFLRARGIDLTERYGSDGWFMPLQSVFVIDRTGQISAVLGEADPRKRPEPVEILSAATDTGSKA